MNDPNVMLRREQLSALADGELRDPDIAQALGYAATEEGQACWQVYHLIGESLRRSEPAASSGMASGIDNALLTGLRARMAQETPVLRLTPAVVQTLAEPLAAPYSGQAGTARDPAANAEVWRWKMAAGFASLAAVAVLGWHTYAGIGGGPQPQGAQLAVAPAPAAPAAPAATAPAAPAPTVQAALTTANAAATPASPDAAAPQIMLRDPRLDELLAAHRQLGHSTTALQMPADFLRNASFSGRER